MDVKGSCHCGNVEFDARVDPRRIGICHCADCQTFSGSAFRVSVLVSGDDFKLQKGDPSVYEKTAESGNRRKLMFCGDCGTHIYGTTEGTEKPVYSVRVGVLAERANLQPVVQVWCRSEVPWLENLSDIHRLVTQ